MDGREAMDMSGSFYIQHRGIGGQGSAPQSGGFHGFAGVRPMSSPGVSSPAQSSHIGSSGFQVDVASSASAQGANVGAKPTVVQSEPLKRKRGRPRKYGPDSSVSLALSPGPSARLGPVSMAVASVSGSMSASGMGSATPAQKRGRGRPPGTGRKQQLASLGEWIYGSAGMGFTPHIITIEEGEDIAGKIMLFAQQGLRAVCILSANGAVSQVSLQQSSTSGVPATYEGRFEILCLSGIYMLTDDGGSQCRTGGLRISISDQNGRVLGGGVSGLLIAASPVQVILGSFIYGGNKLKNKTKTSQEPGTETELPTAENQSTPMSMMPNQSLNPAMLMGGWPNMRQMDLMNTHIDLDLTSG